MPNYKERSFRYLKYLRNAERDGVEGYPLLNPTNSIPNAVVSFNCWRSAGYPSGVWVDHFIDDGNFNCVYNDFFRYAAKYQKAKGVIGTDYSAYRDMPAWQRKESVGKNRTIDYLLQSLYGIDVIPVISFAYIDDLDWSLGGIPMNSSVAMSTNGSMANFVSHEIFIDGAIEVEKRLRPSCLIISGGPVPELDALFDNIFYYPNYSQRLAARRRQNG